MGWFIVLGKKNEDENVKKNKIQIYVKNFENLNNTFWALNLDV